MKSCIRKTLIQFALVIGIGGAFAGIQQVHADVYTDCNSNVVSVNVEPGSEGFTKQPMNLNTFQGVVTRFTKLTPKEASTFLINTNSQDPSLAETLMLYQRRLDQPSDVETAFLFYVINTSEPLLGDEKPEVLLRLEQNYRKSLLLGDRTNSNNEQSKTLCDLRRLGQSANRSRYGRGDVIPTALLSFDELAGEYSHLNAVWMAEQSALAYWDQEKVKQQLHVWRYEFISEITDAETETTAYLAGKDNHVVLSFRGTSSLKDFITDVDIRKSSPDWADGKIHRGFARALDSVWPDIKKQLGTPAQQQKELWVTGHSLGAALAQLAALRLTKLGYRLRAVYTYGTPRVGNEDFVADYDNLIGDRTFSHINRNDLVTKVPSAWLGYRTSAKNQIRKFTGTGHEMESLTISPDEPRQEDEGEESEKISRAVSSIRSTTSFLPESLKSPSLKSPSLALSDPGAPPQMNLYSNKFETGPLDEHGSFEYLFKLGCVALEKNLWQIEANRAGLRVGKLDFQ